MGFRKLCLAVLTTLALTTSVQGKTAYDFCPTYINASCLDNIAEHFITGVADTSERQKLVLEYAKMMTPKAPDQAARLINKHTKHADWESLRRLANAFAKVGHTKEAARFIWSATQARANDPNSRVKVLDMLLMVEDAADIKDLILARRIHNAIVPHLPGNTGGFVPLSDELRVARLMALYGWPKDAHPFLEAAYSQLKTLPQDSQNYGFTLTRFVTVLALTGHNKIYQQAKADISRFLTVAKPNIRHQVKRSYITALVQAGKIKDAKVKATEYGLDFDKTIQNVPHLFFQNESEYFPGIPDDTLRRFEAMLAAVESPTLKATFITKLASRMIQDKQFDKLDTLLDRVKDPKFRSDLVLELMIYHGRERKDAKTAADLYFAEKPKLTPKLPQLGTFLQRYPLSLTASGLLKTGDIKRGGQLADVVFRLWNADKSNHRRLEILLIGALAVAGDADRVNMWYAASNDPGHKMGVLFWTLHAQVNAGKFSNKDDILKQAKELLPLISNEVRGGRSMLDELRIEIVMALAKHDRLAEAKKALAALGEREKHLWRAELAIAKAAARAGDINLANATKRAILNKLLDGAIEMHQMPYVINAMHP